MSVYNSEKTIKKSVESIVNQNFNNFDLLIPLVLSFKTRLKSKAATLDFIPAK